MIRAAALSSTMQALLILLPLVVAAQEDRRAHVEVIIFETAAANQESSHALAEMTVAQPSSPVAAFNLFAAFSAAADRDIRLSHDRHMLEEYRRLAEAPAYNVIWHVAWTQPHYQLGQEVAIKLLQQRRENLVAATAYLVYSNLYRLKIDILYDISPYQHETSIPRAQLLPVRFEKVMAPEKIYYLDHELLGALVRITELKAVP